MGYFRLGRLGAIVPCVVALAQATTFPPPAGIERFEFRSSGLRLARPVTPGAFFDVVGRRSAVFGYEDRGFEAWIYPLKILDDFHVSFRLEGYPLEIDGRQIASTIAVRPESTTFTFSHAAFTARETIVAPIDDPAVIILFEADSVLPLELSLSFRPRLSLMWPAGLMTGNVGWDANARAYTVTEESGRFAAMIGSPAARDASLMPYQEEPRDVPVRFTVGVSSRQPVPVIVAGSVEGLRQARQTYERLAGSIPATVERTAAHYRDLATRHLAVSTPAREVDRAFEWAKVGVDKGLATNPLLGSGLLAGFRTSGASERPGFAWFFGRDSMWTVPALTSTGDFAGARIALEFIRKYQRKDGKVPHEISQSATLLPWFTDYPYAWASADATPLYVLAHADYWNATGDREFLGLAWDSIVRAYRFTAGTDSDGNGLPENTNVGHGWVEGGALYPAHEEIYMQGLWIEATRRLAELAGVMGDAALAAEARQASERTRSVTEKVYWLDDRKAYAFATKLPRKEPAAAEPGPARERRQRRLDALAAATLIDEDTVLPAVPLWWGTLADDRAQLQIDRLGAGDLATDWGARILSDRSELYDPLSYHYGSVWPLFTGWVSMAGYRYGRPHVGYQALMSNVLLSESGALGYLTELLSGDFNAAFGRSSHHQIWSEAMVVIPIVRGLMGVSVEEGGTSLRFAPQLPADWDQVGLNRVAAGAERYDLSLRRARGELRVSVKRTTAAASRPLRRLVIAPAFPLDATVRAVTVNGRDARFAMRANGDVQHAEVVIEQPATPLEVLFRHVEGTDVWRTIETPRPGARSEGLRILRSRADVKSLRLTLEGLGSRAYALRLRSPRTPGAAEGVRVSPSSAGDPELLIRFDGPGDRYVRREVVIPLKP